MIRRAIGSRILWLANSSVNEAPEPNSVELGNAKEIWRFARYNGTEGTMAFQAVENQATALEGYRTTEGAKIE